MGVALLGPVNNLINACGLTVTPLTHMRYSQNNLLANLVDWIRHFDGRKQPHQCPNSTKYEDSLA